MTPRERIMAIIVVGLVVAAGGLFLFNVMFWKPLNEKEASIRTYRDDTDANDHKLEQTRLDQARLERLKLLSLPPNVDVAMREYGNYLTDLLIRSGFSSSEISVQPKKPDPKVLAAKVKPSFIALDFDVDCPGKLDNVVRMLEGFYRTSLLHEIKMLSIDKKQLGGAAAQSGDLVVKMRIEALIVTGAEPRKYLLPNVSPRVLAAEVTAALTRGPAGLAWAAWAAGPSGPVGPTNLASLPRRYAAIAEKNIFVGPSEAKLNEPPVNVAQFVYLTDISHDDKYLEGHLYNRWENRDTRLRKIPGFDFFSIRDNNGTLLVSGKVIYMDARELVFEAEEKLYRLHVGQNIEEAMKQPVSREEVDSKIKEAEKVTSKE
jgi:hypothetical protein